MDENTLTLRQHIAAAIENASDAGNAAIDVIRLLENCGFSLYGNGWLDGDTELLQILGYGDSEGSAGDAGMPEGDSSPSAADDFSATLAAVDAFFWSATGGVDQEQNTESREEGSPS